MLYRPGGRGGGLAGGGGGGTSGKKNKKKKKKGVFLFPPHKRGGGGEGEGDPNPVFFFLKKFPQPGFGVCFFISCPRESCESKRRREGREPPTGGFVMCFPNAPAGTGLLFGMVWGGGPKGEGEIGGEKDEGGGGGSGGGEGMWVFLLWNVPQGRKMILGGRWEGGGAGERHPA